MKFRTISKYNNDKGATSEKVMMIRSKVALISSVVILGICMYLYFPFPNNVMLEARSTFMSFPIRNQEGFILLGIIGSILFIIAMILLVIGMKKYRFRTIIIVVIIYAVLPKFLITELPERESPLLQMWDESEVKSSVSSDTLMI